MTRSKNGQADLAPSLFPFLAVLLCTVGALVLILVLVVSQSQASVRQASQSRDERAAELKSQVEVIRDSFRKDREKIQLAIEKKRLSLQGLEQQTNELAKELEDLNKTAELIEKKLSSDEVNETSDAALSDLQKKLQEAAELLKTKVKQPTGDKPVFAIVPYEGSNGTHRRPIYLECRADGIVIQPEGVLIGLKDLKPPYGPGNPLDAALRAIRTHYAPKDGALNTSAYPLLVVRSSGIRTYALARLAMSGWDDQFGYELVEDDMELSYPEGEPDLGNQIERTLASARSRQAALVMAMPGRYRRAMAELDDDKLNFDEVGDEDYGAGGIKSDDNQPASDDLELIGGDAVGSATSGTGGRLAGSELNGSGRSGSGRSGSGLGSDGSDEMPGFNDTAFPGQSTARGGFAFAPDGGRMASGGGPSSGSTGGGLQGFASGGDSATSDLSGSDGPRPDGRWNGSGPPSTGTAGAQSFAEGAFSGNRYTRGAAGNGSQGSGEGGGQSATGGAQQGDQAASSSNRAGTFRDAMTAARSRQQGSPESQSSQSAVNGANSSAADVGTGGSQTTSPRSEGFGSASSNSDQVSAEATMSPSASLSARKKQKENAEAVAKRKGRNWAWSAGPARDTPIVRSIRIVCYEDRWVVLPEQGGTDKPQTVMLDVALQTSAEDLAKVIAARVDRWGFALAGGYWKPVLQVEVASGGQRRFEQLKRLLDGSGLDIQPASATLTTPPSSLSRPAIK